MKVRNVEKTLRKADAKTHVLKTAVRREQKKKKAAAVSSPDSAVAAAPKGGHGSLAKAVTSVPESERPEPPYNYEVHIKNEKVIVTVTLAHVPPRCIDVQHCTPRVLKVDCATHSKPYLLVFELPFGITMHHRKAEYEFDGRVLRCVLPCVSMPAAAIDDRREFVERAKAAQQLRFTSRRDGSVGLRTRRTTLALTEPTKRSKRRRSVEESDAAKPLTASAGADAAEAPVRRPPTPTAAPRTAASPSSRPSPLQPKFTSDAEMQGIASRVAKEARETVRQKMKEAREEQARRERKLEERGDRQMIKKQREDDAFLNVLHEKKKKNEAAVRAAQPAPKKKDSGKKVRFD